VLRRPQRVVPLVPLLGAQLLAQRTPAARERWRAQKQMARMALGLVVAPAWSHKRLKHR
jgi:hypothetical protein